MKTVRKLTTLLLVLVMLFSLCASAGAANVQTATLTVTYGGEALLEETVSAGATVKDTLDAYADILELEWAVLNYPNSTTPDYVIDTIYGVGSAPIGAASGIQTEFWSTAYPGYGLEYSEIANDRTVYHYIYVGNEWRFTVNGVTPESCMQVGNRFFPEYLFNRYIIQSGDAVVIDYLELTHRWTDNSNWLTD